MVKANRTAKATGADLHAFIRLRFGMGDRLYGVVDAVRDKELAYAAPRKYGQTIHWLFEEGSGSHMLDVAPYLVPITFRPKYPYEGSGYLDLWTRGLGSSAGILLITPIATDVLLSHLRDIFRVTDETGHRFFFRFYDPRVLRTYLPTCTPAEAKQFFGQVRHILVEAAKPGKMLSYSPERSGVQTDEGALCDSTPERTGR